MKSKFQTKNKFLFTILFSVILLANTNAQKISQPNVLFIMIDDLGWKDVGFMGSTYYETPNVDALAESGMSFMNAYSASPLCSATRTSIMSGTWPARNGLTSAAGHLKEVSYKSTLQENVGSGFKAIQAISASRIKPEYYTMAQAFKDGGYTTGHIGKWHIGDGPSNPLNQGFDVDIPHTNAPSPLPNGWFAPWPVWEGEGKKGDHLEDRMAEEAVNFLKNNNPKKTGKPFLLDYWAFSVHSPWKAKKEIIEKYEKKANYYEAQHSAVYAAMVEIMDQAVGRLMNTLKEEGLIESTIVIFYSDNGGWFKSASRFVDPDYVHQPLGSNYPLRDGKASIYEGGTRVPLSISWPGQIKAGSMNHQAIVSSVDIYPTLVVLCGIKAKQETQLDGVSIKPALMGKDLERDEIYCHFPHYIPSTGNVPSSYVRKGDWKLIKHYYDNDDQTHRYELFNLHTDIGETINLAKVYPNRVEELSLLIEKHLDETGGVEPIANPEYND
ncbi:MAG: sulfatase [Cyclobacteriaceae bacterium]